MDGAGDPSPRPSGSLPIIEQDQNDSLPLFSVPWEDIMDFNFEGASPESFEGGTIHFGAPNRVYTGTSNSTNTSSSTTSAHVRTASDLVQPSAGNLPDTGSTQTSGNLNPGIGLTGASNDAMSHKRMRFNTSVGSSTARDPCQPSAPDQSGITSAPMEAAIPGMTLEAQPSLRRDLFLLTSEQKETCIQSLSELSSSLMKHLNRLASCKLASSFVFTPSDRNTAKYLFQTLDGSTSHENAIGRMLHGSERFLEILRLFDRPQDAQSSSSSAQSLDSEAYSFVDSAEPSPESNVQERVEMRWNLLQKYLGRTKTLALPATSPMPGGRHNLLSSGPYGILDVPSKLAILTCYTCLLIIFETVFICIHHFLECSPSTIDGLKLPPTVSGLHINGFPLNNYRGLQIKILIQVSTHMLDSIEQALRLTQKDGDEKSGLLADPVFRNLLHTSLKQEGINCSAEDELGMNRVRGLVREVETLLK